jgi:hypothetical protein
VARTIGDPQTRPQATSDDECENHRADSTEPEESPSANGTARPATPGAEGVARLQRFGGIRHAAADQGSAECNGDYTLERKEEEQNG